MTPRGTVVLWSVVAMLGAYLWLTQPQGHDRAHDGAEDEPAPSTGPLLLDLRPEDVTTLIITGAGDALRLRRAASDWRDDHDLPWPTPGLVETVLETLAGTRVIALIEEVPSDLADYGLDPPQRSITVVTSVTGGAAGSLTLLVGDRNPAWTGVYVRVPPADRVVLIGSVLPWEIDKLVGAARQADREEGRE